MADRPDQSFEVVATRIGGTGGSGRPGGRRRRVPIALVIAVAVAIPAIAWVGPRMEWRPEIDLSFLRPTPTPIPSKTARPVFQTTPIPATPLPDVTVGTGEHPTEPFPIDVNGLHLVDPVTGQLGPTMELRLDTDAVFAAADGNGWWCVCFNRSPSSDHETVAVEIRHVDGTGRTTARQPISEYASTATPPASDFYSRFDLELAPDGRTGYLASATRSGNEWAVAIETIDLEAGVLSGHVDLGSLDVTPIAGPSPPPDQGINDSYISGPFIRLSPDGRTLLAWAWVDQYTWNGEQGTSMPLAWTIGLDVGGVTLGRPTAFDEAAADRLRQCVWAAWTGPDEITTICWPRDQATLTLGASILRADLSEVRRADITGTMESWFAEPILDLANRALYLWQPNAHVLHRLDIDQGRTDRIEVDPDSTVGGPGASGAGPGGLTSRTQPEWATLLSDFRPWYTPQLIPEPGGSRLFALGSLQGRRGDGGPDYSSTGIWVFDTREFTVVDRWAPVTGYSSLNLSDDGRWLMAVGMPGIDADGNPATWQSSLTIHDTTDGRPALQLGSLGTDNQVLQLPR